MANQFGIVARITAVNGVPSYQGYDLEIKNDKKLKDFTIDNFELIFQGHTCVSKATLDPTKVLENIDKTIFRIYEQTIETADVTEDTPEEKEKRQILNGQIIKEIVVKGNKSHALLTDETHEVEATKIINEIMGCWTKAKMLRDEKEKELNRKMKTGVLDIQLNTETKEEKLVLRTESSFEFVTERVSIEKVKESLFYFADLYKNTEEYKKQHSTLSCKYEESGYVCEIVNNKMKHIYKADGELSDLELAIAKDLLKLNN